MLTALGGELAEPSLSVRKLDPGDELILMTDGGIDNMEDPETGETDLKKMEDSTQGATSKERLNRFRKIAKQGRKDDDIAIVAAQVK
jgi:serine/threonine protein phosphatase PrpC